MKPCVEVQYQGASYFISKSLFCESYAYYDETVTGYELNPMEIGDEYRPECFHTFIDLCNNEIQRENIIRDTNPLILFGIMSICQKIQCFKIKAEIFKVYSESYLHTEYYLNQLFNSERGSNEWDDNNTYLGFYPESLIEHERFWTLKYQDFLSVIGSLSNITTNMKIRIIEKAKSVYNIDGHDLLKVMSFQETGKDLSQFVKRVFPEDEIGDNFYAQTINIIEKNQKEIVNLEEEIFELRFKSDTLQFMLFDEDTYTQANNAYNKGLDRIAEKLYLAIPPAHPKYLASCMKLYRITLNNEKKEFYKSLIIAGSRDFINATNDQSPDFLYDCSQIYHNGFGVEKDVPKAMELARIAADNGYQRAQNWFGYMLLYGIDVPMNISLAFDYFSKSAEFNNVFSHNNLGYLYEGGELLGSPDIPQALKHYKLSASLECPHGLYNLGRCYQNGIGIVQDKTKAYYLYKRAAIAGYYDAYSVIGSMFENGDLGSEDIDQAISEYQKGAEKDVKFSISSLGYCYYMKGEYELAHQYISQTLDLKKSRFVLAKMHIEGKFVEKDLSKSLELLNGLVSEEYNGIENEMGLVLYELGDYSSSIQWLIKATESSINNSTILLSNCYLKGLGTEKNIEKAIGLLNQAGENGFSEAHYRLGNLFYKGKHVPKDDDSAYLCYLLASESGHEQAQIMLSKFNEK